MTRQLEAANDQLEAANAHQEAVNAELAQTASYLQQERVRVAALQAQQESLLKQFLPPQVH